MNPTPARSRRDWMRLGVFGVVAATILYLELKPDPSIAHVPFMPRVVGTFFDTHDFLNNVLGFGVLAAATHYAFCGWRVNQARFVFLPAASIGVGIVGLELAQRSIPGRNFDCHDILAGWLGVAAVSAFWLTGRRPRFFDRES